MPDIFFEDLPAGRVSIYGPVRVDRDEMVAFAREFDPQPFHLDEEAARDTFVGRLIASGWYTLGLKMRMWCDAWVLRAASLGGPGVAELKWLRPVIAGEELRLRETILDARLSRTRPGVGIVQFRLEGLNSDGQPVTDQTHSVLLGCRGHTPEAAAFDTAPRRVGADAPALAPSAGAPHPLGSPVIGQRVELGTHTFVAEDVIRFARLYDPQPFHIDAEAAKRSAFGRLAASGWHTGAMWMRRLVDARAEAARSAEAAGQEPPRFGPSPGFRNLRWVRPVYAGDAVRYTTTPTGMRASASRPGWHLVASLNEGFNQHGEKVFEFEGSGFAAFGSAPR